MTRRSTKQQAPVDDFPKGMSQPALRALATINVTQLSQLTAVSESELAALHGMGPKGIRLLRDALKAQKKSFAKR